MNDLNQTGSHHPENGPNVMPAPRPGARDRSDLEQPQRIGRYRVERVLGRGDFGLVYLANDEQLQRRVAIKVPHRDLVSRPDARRAWRSCGLPI